MTNPLGFEALKGILHRRIAQLPGSAWPRSRGAGLCALRRRPPVEPGHASRSARATKAVDGAPGGWLSPWWQRWRRRPEVRQQRKQRVDHPLGTMQRWRDAGDFLMRGLAKVRTEFRVTVLAYHLRRVVHLVEMPRLLPALG